MYSDNLMRRCKKTVNRSSARIFRDLEGLHARVQLDKKVTQVN